MVNVTHTHGRRTVLALTLLLLVLAQGSHAQPLEVHYINVGWGSSVFVKGPNGITVLVEAGKTGMGTGRVVPYLTSIGFPPAGGLDYTIVGHQHEDHLGGMDEVIQAGYDVRRKNYFNGSSAGVHSMASGVPGWNSAAGSTTAGTPAILDVGTEIDLGSGAKLICIARDGHIIGGGTVHVINENDRSIAVLIKYGGFDYLWASDLGGGNIDGTCTNRHTATQIDVESSVIEAISPGGAAPLISAGGIDVLNCNHHGSESSTNKNWMNLARPAVAVIPTGGGQNSSAWHLPRKDVVENVLHAEAACITVPPALVLQTEEGYPVGNQTSYAGYCVGNIKITTDGVATFTVSADGQVSQGLNELTVSGLPKTIPIDDGGPPPPPPTPAPVISAIQAVSNNATTAQISWTTDQLATTEVEYGLTATYGSVYSDQSYGTTHQGDITSLQPSTAYHYRVISRNQAGTQSLSSDQVFTTQSVAQVSPSRIVIMRGEAIPGNLASLYTDDGDYLSVNATPTEQIRYVDWYGVMNLTAPPSTIDHLVCSFVGRYSRAGVKVESYLYNWLTARWNKMGETTGGTTDAPITVLQSDLSKYLSQTGEVRFRIKGTKDDNRRFKCHADLMTITVENTP